MADEPLFDSAVEAAPNDYPIPAGADRTLKSVTAAFDGTLAAGSFQPAVQILSPSGAVVVTAVCTTTLAAGGSADVSWFPEVGGGGSGGAAGNTSLQVPLDTPDASGNAFPWLTSRQGFTNVRRVLPSFLNGAAGSWTGSVIVPTDYNKNATLTLYLAIDATTGNVKTNVATSVVGAGGSADSAYTTEATVTTTVPATANLIFTVVFVLSTVPVPGAVMNVQVNRLSTDTCAAILQCLSCELTYS